MRQKSILLRTIVFSTIILGLNACFLSDMHLREYLRPIRRVLNHERSYWTDKIEYRGGSGTEVVYYKNGRPALERNFDENGLLGTVSYFGRNGQSIRMDSLVYAGEELIAGYYYAEPDHTLILRFLSYKQQGQLSQRSWFGSEGELLSREFFLFDRKGHRHSRMIFDGNDSLLYSETFKRGTDQLELQNAYSLDGNLASQVRYEKMGTAFCYNFDPRRKVTRISQLHKGGTPIWSSDLFYDQDGALESSNFSTNGRFIFSYQGDFGFYHQSLQSWKHPDQPTQAQRIVKYGHHDPFKIERIVDDQGRQTLEYRLPGSGALFKRSTLNDLNQAIADTLYAGRGGLQAVCVSNYDSSGLLNKEVTYDLDGVAKWQHTWIRDNDERVIREELTALPDTFAAAVTRFYDSFGSPAFSERFSSPDSFDGSWVFYHGGGVNKTLFYNDTTELVESWLFRPAGDTAQHSRFQRVDYILLETKLGALDTLLSQRRFTKDGMLNWELFFDRDGYLSQETHRKKDGTIYREVSYDPDSRVIKSSSYSPINIDELPVGAELRGELSSQMITRLDPQGETVQIISKNSSGDMSWEKRYAYRKGRLVKSAQMGPDGKPVLISTYTHNEQGQVLTETAVDRLDTLIHRVEYRYNEKQELIWKMFSSTVAGIASSNRYYYDDSGRLMRNEIIEAQQFIEAVEYEYHPEYYLRIATHYEPDGSLLRKEIENYFGDDVFAIGAAGNEEQSN